MSKLQYKLNKPSQVQISNLIVSRFVFKVYHLNDLLDVISSYLQVVFGKLEVIEELKHFCQTHRILLLFHIVKCYSPNVDFAGRDVCIFVKHGSVEFHVDFEPNDIVLEFLFGR